jgi:hypothetical protein
MSTIKVPSNVKSGTFRHSQNLTSGTSTSRDKLWDRPRAATAVDRNSQVPHDYFAAAIPTHVVQFDAMSANPNALSSNRCIIEAVAPAMPREKLMSERV